MNDFIFPALVALFLVIPSVALPVPRAAGQLVPGFNSGPDPRDGDIFVQPRLPPRSLDSALVPRSLTAPRTAFLPSPPASIEPVFSPSNFKSSYVLDTNEGHSHRAHLAQLAQWRAVAKTYKANQGSAYPRITDPTPIASSNHQIVHDALQGTGEDKDLWWYMFLPDTRFTQAQHGLIFEGLESGNTYHLILLGRNVVAACHAEDFKHLHHSTTDHTVTLHPSFLTGMRQNLGRAGAEKDVYDNLGNIPLTRSHVAYLTEDIKEHNLKGMKDAFTHAHQHRPPT